MHGYTDINSFIVNITTEDIFKYFANEVEKGFDISNYEVERLLPINKNKKVTGLIKDELGGKIMKGFIGLKPKTYSYFIDDGSNDKKAKGTKKCAIKQRLKFEDYKKCLQNSKIILISQQKFKSEAHNVFTEKVYKI